MADRPMTHFEKGMAISNRPGGIMQVNHTGEAGFTGEAHVIDVIDTTIGSLQHAIERINSVEYRLRRIADRTVGSVPTPITDKVPTPREPTIQALLGDLGGSVERLFTELSRLNDGGR